MASVSKRTKPINFRLKNERHFQVYQLAEKKGTTVTELLRRWIDIGYAAENLEVKASSN